MSTYIDWEVAQQEAKKAPARGFMPPASAIEIALPDIAASIYLIRKYSPVPYELKAEYLRARGEAFAYGGDERRTKAENLLDRVLGSLRKHNLRASCRDVASRS